MIEKCGAEYRAYSAYDMNRAQSGETGQTDISVVFGGLMDIGVELLPELIEACKLEKPDMIFQDSLTFPARYLQNYLQVKTAQKKLDFPLPKFVNIYSTFALVPGIFPPDNHVIEIEKMSKTSMIYNGMKLFFKQKMINFQLDLNLSSDPRQYLAPIDGLNFTTVAFEVQPNSDKMIDIIKFPGVCFTEEARSVDVKEEKLKEILNVFHPINPSYLVNNVEQNNEKKLVYVSLGTVAFDKMDVFKKIIEAFRVFVEETQSVDQIQENFKQKHLEIVFELNAKPHNL